MFLIGSTWTILYLISSFIEGFFCFVIRNILLHFLFSIFNFHYLIFPLKGNKRDISLSLSLFLSLSLSHTHTAHPLARLFVVICKRFCLPFISFPLILLSLSLSLAHVHSHAYSQHAHEGVLQGEVKCVQCVYNREKNESVYQCVLQKICPRE